MAHHAYFVAGDQKEGQIKARRYAEQEVGLSGTNNPDISILTFGLFSVEDARKLIDAAHISSTSGTKVIIASTTRIFHEAQNALLKVLEEPPAGVTIILCVPSEGIFIPTLRSRLLPLPGSTTKKDVEVPTSASEFLAASAAEREKFVSKLVDRSKSDKDEVKQEARREAIELIQGVTEAAHTWLHSAKTAKDRLEAKTLLEDLASFMPILYERSAPLKLIFEHLLLVIPKTLKATKV